MQLSASQKHKYRKTMKHTIKLYTYHNVPINKEMRFHSFFCCRTQKRDALGSAKIAVDRAVRGISSGVITALAYIAVVFFSQTAIDPGGVFNGGLVPNCCLLCLIASLSQLCLFASSPACFRFLGDPDWGPLDVFSWPKAYWLTGNLFF